MNQNQSSGPASRPDITTLNERIASGVQLHQRKMRALTGAAFLFGFLAVTASIAVVAAYFVFYRPKQMELLRQVTIAAQALRTNPAPPPQIPENPPLPPLDFPSVQVTMTHVLGFGTMLVAIAVGLSAGGTLVMLALVVLSRRATLSQINLSLAQISTQLKDLRALQAQAAKG